MANLVGLHVRIDGQRYYNDVMAKVIAQYKSRKRFVKLFPEMKYTLDYRVPKKNSINRATALKIQELFGIAPEDYPVTNGEMTIVRKLPMFNAELLAVEIVRAAYNDYVTARAKCMAFEAHRHPTSYCYEAKMEYVAMRKSAEKLTRSRFRKVQDEEEIQWHIAERLETVEREYKTLAEDCRVFFRSRWFSMMIENMGGDEFLKFADQKVLEWASGKVTKRELLSRSEEESENYERNN